MRKSFVSALIGIMLFGSLTGCSSNTPTNSNKTEEKPKVEAEKKEEEKAEEKVEDTKEVVQEEVEEEPEMDLGGRTIKFGANWDPTPNPNTASGERALARKAELEEKYNCVIEFVCTADLGQGFPDIVMTTTTLAGDPAADICYINEGINYSLISKGVILPLNEIESVDIDNPQWEPYSKKAGTFGDKIYSANGGNLDMRGGFFYNKRMFEEAGLPDLYELQRTGEWTWEKMEEFAKKLTVDKDGDGIIDQYGLAHFTDFVLQLIYSNNGDIIAFDGVNADVTLDSENTMEALQFYNKLVNELKVTYKQREGEGWDYHMAAFRDGKAAMLGYQRFAVGSFMDMEDDYGYVMMPKGPKSDQYTSLLTGINAQVMSSAVENPEEVGFIFKKWNEPYPEDTPDTWKDNQYNLYRDSYAVDETITMQKTMSVLPGYCSFNVGPELVELDRSIHSGDLTPAAAVEAIVPQIEAKLKESLGK